MPGLLAASAPSLALMHERRGMGVLGSSDAASCITPVQHVYASLADVLLRGTLKVAQGLAILYPTI